MALSENGDYRLPWRSVQLAGKFDGGSGVNFLHGLQRVEQAFRPAGSRRSAMGFSPEVPQRLKPRACRALLQR